MRKMVYLITILIISLNGNSQTAEEYLSMGSEKFAAGKDYEALVYYTKSIEIDPTKGDVYSARGVVKINLGDYYGAIADCNKAFELSRNKVGIYYVRGLAKYGLSDYRGAIADYSKCLINSAWSTGYFTASCYFYRGKAKYHLEDYQGAIADFTKSIDTCQDFGEYHYNRGLAKIKLGEKESGCLDLSKAGELGYKKAYETIRDLCN